MAKTNYRTWTTGEIVTAVMLNEQIKDNGNAIWVGTTAGDMDYYTSATEKARIAKGTEGQSLKSIAGVPTWTGLVGAKIFEDDYQSIANDSETIITTYGTETYDSHGFHSGTDGILTVPTGLGGLYLIGANGYFDGHATANRLRQLGLRKNSTNIAQVTTVQDADSSSIWMNIFHLDILNEGDTIKTVVLQKSGTSLKWYWYTLWMIKL